MPGKVAGYNGSVDSGGAGACNTPPFTIGPVTPRTVTVGGLYPILEGDVLTPAPGTTPGGNPCSTPRVAISATTKVRMNGRRPCCPGDFLATATGITITPASANPKVNVV